MLRAGSRARPLHRVCHVSSLSPTRARRPPRAPTVCHVPGESVCGSRHKGQTRGLRRSFRAFPTVGSTSADRPDACPHLHVRQHGIDSISRLHFVFSPNFSKPTVVEAQEQRKSTTSSVVPGKEHRPHSPAGRWLPTPFDGNELPGPWHLSFSPRVPRWRGELRVCILTVSLSAKHPLLGRFRSSLIKSLWLSRARGPHVAPWSHGERRPDRCDSCCKYLHFVLVFFASVIIDQVLTTCQEIVLVLSVWIS